MKYLILLLVICIPIFSENNVKEHETPVVVFTEEETSYLKQKREITLCGQKDWLPYTNFTDEKPKGIIPELIDRYENIIGIPLKYVKTSNWIECRDKTKNREIDIVDIILKNPNIWKYLTPSNTYLSDFLILVTKVEKPYINNIADANHMNVAMVGTYKNMLHYVKKQYPNLHLSYVKNLKEGLKKVSKGQVDAYMGIFMPTTFMINKQYIKELKINGRFSELQLDGAFGVRSDEPLLVSILNKAINALEPIKKREIINSWISIKQEKAFDYSLFFEVLCAIAALLIMFGYRQYILKRENKELREKTLKLSHQAQIIEEISDAIVSTDMKGNIITLNTGTNALLGYSTDEMMDKHISMIYRPEDMPIMKKNIQLLMQTGKFSTEMYLVKKSKDTVPVLITYSLLRDENGIPLYIIGYGHDLTQYKKSEKKLQQSEQALKILNDDLEKKIEVAIADLKKSQHQAKLGSWKLDIVNDQLSWSDETYHIFELPETSKISSSKDFLAAIHPEDIEKVRTAYTKSLETQEPYEIVHRLSMKDGRIKYVRENCETTFDNTGRALVSIGTIQDITDQYIAEETLREKKDLMFKQSRLAQMGEMISMIAHQWRQPLSAISATTNALILKNERGGYESRFFEDKLRKIAIYSQHLSATIDDFRNFFKTHKEKEESTLEAVVEDVLSITQSSLENKNINIITDFKYNKTVNIYTNELKQVLLNLIKNAEDILLENKIVTPEIIVRTFEENGYMVLSIEDNGGGIDKALTDKIFNPYFSTKLNKEGTGLGLYMSKIIIQEHCAGTLSVKNGSNGAIFKIKIKGKAV